MPIPARKRWHASSESRRPRQSAPRGLFSAGRIAWDSKSGDRRQFRSSSSISTVPRFCSGSRSTDLHIDTMARQNGMPSAIPPYERSGSRSFAFRPTTSVFPISKSRSAPFSIVDDGDDAAPQTPSPICGEGAGGEAGPAEAYLCSFRHASITRVPCPLDRTFGKTCATFPCGSIRKVIRCIPMNVLP